MSHHVRTRSHHHQHPRYPAERIGECTQRSLDADTMAVVDAGEAQREAEYQRYLALRQTPEYQRTLAARLAKKDGGR